MESAAAIPSVSVSLCISFSHHHLCQWELVPGKTIGREGCVCRRVCVHTCEDLITSVVEISKLVGPFLFLKLKKFSERNPSQKKEEKFNAVLIDCVWLFRECGTSYKHNADVLWPYKVDILASNYPFTYSSNISSCTHSSFSSIFGLHQLLKEITSSLTAKCSTVFTH